MDEYNCCGPEDTFQIAAYLKQLGAVTFPYSKDKVTCHIITIAFVPNTQVLGTMPWGGPVKDTWIVSLRQRGSNFFELTKEFYWGYVAEKLGLGQTDAEHIAELLTNISEELKK